MTEVAAALIWNEGRNKFLICRRPKHKKRGLLWEFVGGKVEPGESGEQALQRECREELLIDVAVKQLFASVVHQYPDITVRLSVYHAEILSDPNEIKLLEHCEIKWIAPDEIHFIRSVPRMMKFFEKFSLKTV